MRCTCGARGPINSRYSLCRSCLYAPDDDGHSIFDDEELETIEED